MAASVLNTPIAVAASIQVVRAFVRLQKLIAGHEELRQKLEELQKKFGEHDQQFALVFEAIRQLMAPPKAPDKSGRIGFQTPPPSPEK